MNEPDAEHTHNLPYQDAVVLTRGLARELNLPESRSGTSRCIGHQFHDQDAVEVPVRLRYSHTRGYELIQRVHLGIFPGGFLFLATEASALADGTGLPAAADFASFLVLGALLKAALRHVPIDLGTSHL